MTVWAILFEIYFVVGFAVVTLSCLLVRLITAPFDQRGLLLHRWTAWISYHASLIPTLWHCRFSDVERINPNKTYVLVANHQSYADIVVLYGLGRNFKWLAKEHLFKVPLLGTILKLNNHVPLAQSGAGLKKALTRCCELLRKNTSVFIFPEGKRSTDGLIGHFHDGAFRIATKCGVEIVPIVIDSTHQILPRGSWYIRRFDVRLHVRVLEPIAPTRFKNDPEKLRDHVRFIMERELAQMRGEATDAVTVAEICPPPIPSHLKAS